MAEQKPKTINAELIYYMFDEIKLELREMKKDYVTKAESQALKQEIEELRGEIKDLRGKKQVKETILWVGLVASAIINVLALYNVFTGGKR